MSPSVCPTDRICTEDGEVNWFTTGTATEARRTVANECGMRGYDFRVSKRWMRPATLPDGISQMQIEEGWWVECPRTEAGAFPVWRVESS